MSTKSTSHKHNFYLHVNEKWLNDPQNSIPTEYPRWGGFIKLHDTGLMNQIQLVKELQNKSNKNEEEEKISAIWQASRDRFRDWENCTANCNVITKELMVLNEYFLGNNIVQKLAEYFYYTQVNGINNVFDIDKGSDLNNSNNVVLDFQTSGLSLPNRDYYIDSKFADKQEMFKKHLQNVANIIAKSGFDLGNDFVQNIIDFEHSLARYKMKSDQSRRYNEYYTSTTLTDLHEQIDNLVSLPDKRDNYTDEENKFELTSSQKELIKMFLERVYELFDLRKILEENRQKSFIGKAIPNPPHPEQIIAYDGDAIRRVFALILNHGNSEKYKQFLQYKIIFTFNEFCTKELNDEFFDFYNRKLSGQLEQKPDDKRSIGVVNMYASEMMGKVFVAKYFPETYKIDIRNRISEILDVMSESIKSNDWLTETTKLKALEKLAKFDVRVGYPDKWKDYSEFDVREGDSLCDVAKKAKKWLLSVDFFNKINTVVDRSEWGMSPQTVNAYFSPQNNNITFPSAILQPPFYNKSCDDIDFDISEEKIMAGNDYDFTQAANLGGIGAVIAHEITHGYDDQGRLFDGNGNLNDWWTEEDANLFKGKIALMEEQAEQYKFIDPDSDKIYKLNGKLTMGEMLADVNGLTLALKTMNRHLMKNNAPENVIKANIRVVLKSFANIWKQNTKKDFFINQLTANPHPPSDFRANIVKNMDEFYNVFDIQELDEMYIPSNKRLRMW